MDTVAGILMGPIYECQVGFLVMLVIKTMDLSVVDLDSRQLLVYWWQNKTFKECFPFLVLILIMSYVHIFNIFDLS